MVGFDQQTKQTERPPRTTRDNPIPYRERTDTVIARTEGNPARTGGSAPATDSLRATPASIQGPTEIQEVSLLDEKVRAQRLQVLQSLEGSEIPLTSPAEASSPSGSTSSHLPMDEAGRLRSPASDSAASIGRDHRNELRSSPEGIGHSIGVFRPSPKYCSPCFCDLQAPQTLIFGG